ncbi:Uncharacterised protein [Mycobacteroides abscessus subsp. abscessus]|nr:Uncharacterised protein [Mycobacteroides abscessus subsp. abscessus]
MSAWCAFAFRESSAARSIRSTGSATSEANCVNIPDTLLVPCTIKPLSSAPWTDTGTIATSGLSGSSLCANRYSRSAPPVIANTTSFTLTPKRFLTRLMSASESWVSAIERCGVIGPLNRVRGAPNGAGIASCERARRNHATGTETVSGSSRAIAIGRRIR